MTFNVNEQREQELIRRIRSGDDKALCELCFNYQPLINDLKKNFFVRDYDDQDWEQEALIVCYQSACDFSSKKGHFGPYFKRRLYNQATSLLRKDLAYRRRAGKEAISWELVLVNDGERIKSELSNFFTVPSSEIYSNFLQKLSLLEVKALLLVLGQVSETELQKEGFSHLSLTRARGRVLQKLRQVLFD